MTDTPKPQRGRPRLHPDGLTERLSVPVTEAEYRRLEEQSKRRDMPLAKLVRERLNAGY